MKTHSHKIGDKVTVMNMTLSGTNVVEGIATIRKLLPRADRYMVSFNGERQQFERYVPAEM